MESNLASGIHIRCYVEKIIMSTTITDFPVNSVSDNRLTLSNSQWAATFSFGTDWTRLRIGWRFCIQDSGANITGTPKMMIGVLADPLPGMTNGPLGTSTSHFFGVKTSKPTWSRIGGSYYDIGGGSPLPYQIITRVGSVETVNPVASNFIPARQLSSQTDHRIVGIMEITKGSPNFTLSGWYHASGLFDMAFYDLYRAMEIDPFSTGYWNALGPVYSGTGDTLAVDEATNGYFNSVCVAWNRSSPVVYFSDIAVSKMA